MALQQLSSGRFWAVAGLVLTLAFGLFTVVTWYRSDSPSIRISVTSEIRLFDVRREMADLEILYQGQNVKEKKINFIIYGIAFENDGTRDVLASHFDRRDLWGIQFLHGEIIDANLRYASNDYLKKNIMPKVSVDSFRLPEVIFEKGQRFVFEIIVKHNVGSEIQISPIGKIAGINWSVVDRENAKATLGFLDQVIEGGPFVHLTRFMMYLLGIFIAFTTIIPFAIWFDNTREKIRRGKIERAIDLLGIQDENVQQYLRAVYLKEGREGLENLKEIMSSDDGVRRAKKRYEEMHQNFQLNFSDVIHSEAPAPLPGYDGNSGDEQVDIGPRYSRRQETIFSLWPSRDFEKLRNLGFVSGGARGPVRIDDNKRDLVNDLLRFLG